MTPPTAIHPTAGTRVFRVGGIMLVFAAVGPLLGEIFLLGTVSIHSAAKNGVKGQDILAFVLMILTYGAIAGYLFGIIPAIGVGLIVGIWQVYVGRVAWWLALLVGAIAGAGFIAFVEHERGNGPRDPELYVLLVLVCIVATLGCWWIVRRWYRGSPQETSVLP